MTRPLAILAPVAAAAVLMAVLTGCAPGHHPAPHASASTPSAPVTGAAADTTPPRPALDLDCSRLFASPAFVEDYGAGVLHPVDPLVVQGAISSNIPDADVLQSVGGISCDWSNRAPAARYGDRTNPVEVTLAVLPNATSQWARYYGIYGAAGEGVQCDLGGPDLNCTSEQLIGTNWMELTMFGIVGETQANDLAAAITAMISSAAPGAGPWTPPSGTTTFGDCTQLLVPAQVATDLGVSGIGIQFTQPAGGWSIQAATREAAHAEGCLLQFTGEDNIAGQITWLRGGSWAYDPALAAADPGWGTRTAAPISGLASGDRAQVRCSDPTLSEDGATVCTVDLELGGNWIQVIVSPTPGDHVTADVRTAAVAIAGHLVSGYDAHAH